MSLNNPLATYFNSWITLPSLFTALPVDVYWLDLHYVGIRNTTLCQRFPNKVKVFTAVTQFDKML